METSSLKSSPIRRRDVGLASAIIVVSHLFSSFQASQSIVTEVAKFKEEFQQSLLEREQYFVRKSDFNSLTTKIDDMNLKMTELATEIKFLHRIMASDYSMEDSAEEIIGCDSEEILGLFI